MNVRAVRHYRSKRQKVGDIGFKLALIVAMAVACGLIAEALG